MPNPFDVNPTSPTLPPAPAIVQTGMVDDGRTATIPNVAAPPVPPSADAPAIDRGDDADYEVVHHLVTTPKAELRQGDRISKADLDSPGIDVDRLIKLGAIKAIDDKSPAPVPTPIAVTSPEPNVPKKAK